MTPLLGFPLTIGTSTRYGGRAGAGDVSGDGREDVLGGLGRDGATDSTVYAFR